MGLLEELAELALRRAVARACSALRRALVAIATSFPLSLGLLVSAAAWLNSKCAIAGLDQLITTHGPLLRMEPRQVRKFCARSSDTLAR
jgi:hypothetical protein